MSVDPVFVLVVRAGLVLLFGAAAMHKLREGARFRATLTAYALIPGRLVPAGAVAVVLVEAALAIALAASVRAALPAAAALLAVYGAAIAVNLARGRRDLSCGCVGVARDATISWWHVARNALLAALALGAATPMTVRPLLWVDGFTIVAAVAALGTLYVATDGLAANAPAVARVRSP